MFGFTYPTALPPGKHVLLSTRNIAMEAINVHAWAVGAEMYSQALITAESRVAEVAVIAQVANEVHAGEQGHSLATNMAF